MDKKTSINIRRIYEAPQRSDGYRILIDRLWPRGVKKEDARLDEWNKKLAPSPGLRKWFDHKPERYDEFSARYQEELSHQSEELRRVKKISERKTVTLLYALKDPALSHAPILRETLTQTKSPEES